MQFRIADPATERVRVRVVTIANPEQQALTLTVRLDGLDVGAVAIHPPNAPAEYVLSLPPEAVARIRSGPATLHLTLATLRPDETLRTDVVLTVTAGS